MTKPTRMIQGDGYRHGWGIRRTDGQPWRTQPSKPGAHDYYVIGDEVSEDGMVLGCGEDALEAVTCALAQRSDAPVLHAGEAVVVQAHYRRDPGTQQWTYVYEDAEHSDLVRRIKVTLEHAARLLADVHVLDLNRAP